MTKRILVIKQADTKASKDGRLMIAWNVLFLTSAAISGATAIAGYMALDNGRPAYAAMLHTATLVFGFMCIYMLERRIMKAR